MNCSGGSSILTGAVKKKEIHLNSVEDRLVPPFNYGVHIRASINCAFHSEYFRVVPKELLSRHCLKQGFLLVYFGTFTSKHSLKARLLAALAICIFYRWMGNATTSE